jgi:hypothetical protein
MASSMIHLLVEVGGETRVVLLNKHSQCHKRHSLAGHGGTLFEGEWAHVVQEWMCPQTTRQ